jgi:cobalt-zinc-cadmium efflux system protein
MGDRTGRGQANDTRQATTVERAPHPRARSASRPLAGLDPGQCGGFDCSPCTERGIRPPTGPVIRPAVPDTTSSAGRGHGHSHGHSHAVSAGADRRYLWTAFGLIVAFMVGEVVVGLMTDSLVLLADAGHMVSDAAAIGLALFAMRLAQRPATGAYTYGLKRAEILSAFANGATLLGLSVFFVVEAAIRLVNPPAVSGTPVLLVALAGVVVNVAATLVLRKADRRSLNVEGSFQHILTDLYAFVGTAVAGVVILTTGFVRADAIASLLVAGLMTKAGVGLVKESGRVVLEASPRGTDPGAVRSAMLTAPGVLSVHELHVWEVTSGFPALSAHVLVDGPSDCHVRRAQLEEILADRFDIQHTTLQVDHLGVDLDRDQGGDADQQRHTGHTALPLDAGGSPAGS